MIRWYASTAQHTDYQTLYEQAQVHTSAQQIVIDELKQDNNLLRLQILELQKFIFTGRQEKFTPAANSHEVQTTLFENDKIAEVVIESTRQVKGYDVKQTAVRVNHPGRKALPAHLRREEIILTPTEDITGLQAVGREVTELLEYKQGELYVKKYIRPEYIKPTGDGTAATRVIAPLPNMPIPKSYVGASLLAYLMVSKYIDHLPVYRQLQMLTRQKIVLEDNTVNPIEWLTYVFENINNHKINAIDQLLPQNYTAH